MGQPSLPVTLADDHCACPRAEGPASGVSKKHPSRRGSLSPPPACCRRAASWIAGSSRQPRHRAKRSPQPSAFPFKLEYAPAIGQRGWRSMTPLLADRYRDRLAGVLSCYDRIVITGTLPGACFAEGITKLLRSRGIRIFDYPGVRRSAGRRLSRPISQIPLAWIRVRRQVVLSAPKLPVVALGPVT